MGKGSISCFVMSCSASLLQNSCLAKEYLLNVAKSTISCTAQQIYGRVSSFMWLMELGQNILKHLGAIDLTLICFYTALALWFPWEECKKFDLSLCLGYHILIKEELLQSSSWWHPENEGIPSVRGAGLGQFSIISNVSLHFDAFENASNSHHHHQLQTHQTAPQLKITASEKERVLQPDNKIKPEELGLLEPSDLARRFDSRVREFFSRNQCEVQGKTILQPLISRGFRVQAMSPDLWALFSNTPAEGWLNDIKNGNKDPGEIPLAQNLSNLIRLAALYKYGGVYLDTDFILLKDFSGLRNAIGAQSIDVNGNWTRLNNAVLIFDKNHPLVYMFVEEFASTFDGNRWGHNGPYLVSRVVNRVAETGQFNFTVLPPMAFYPVDWTRVAGFFVRPSDQVGGRWVEAKIRQLSGETYGVHLWNKQSSRFKIEEGSIIGQRFIPFLLASH
ncbi:Lactosylceramide 4-alpha-galactosyltransferase [Sesamum angolense]|uniref:Lactosylceramide 4-alpha-galactosyltransferase n=1 Tax=Sesamum angolense TaxID=2727404 RepID=A0AAE1WMW7_9LAMI|nr:Lactosylceramide 4-alpha-galactosyltransferase [Sesamum angolense]